MSVKEVSTEVTVSVSEASDDPFEPCEQCIKGFLTTEEYLQHKCTQELIRQNVPDKTIKSYL